MMEVEAPVEASQPTGSRTPEGLRQRQRDRLSPRGRFGKSSRIATTVREMEGTQVAGITLWPAPRSKTMGRRSPDLARKKQLQDGLRKENSVNRRARREAEDGKLRDITPDGGSAGREGRPFTVANVGNNGRIYLRPTIRPANQRYPQPSFVFPITPPGTAGLDALVAHHESDETPRDSLWTPTRSPSTPAAQPRDPPFPAPTPTPPPRHKRAYSYSTIIDEHHVPVRDSDAGAFRVVIERPGGPRVPGPSIGIPTLEVPIPSYKLGTPRFSLRGTAFLRGSSYTTTEDMRSSVFSSTGELDSRRPTRILSRRHSDASRQPQMSFVAPGSASPFNVHPPPGGVVRQRTPIVPEMFDALTFKPGCDHPSVVRYSTNGGIRAATPARIVAEITSPTFVDYDLLSDFFLTFRSFLDTTDLLLMLIARLKWALMREDETGTVVRVRTFVALRHWILNYFVDDYVIDYDLRESFCAQLNTFTDCPPMGPGGAKVPLKILGELKKCWRRVCAWYWDGPEFDIDLGSDVPISPGGVAGSRDPKLDPSFWEGRMDDGPPRLEGIIEPDFTARGSTTADGHPFFADVSRAGDIDPGSRPPTARAASEGARHEPPLSPTSIASEDFVSCSLPPRTRGANPSQPMGAHPVPAHPVSDPSSPIALTPKALTGKRVRPTHSHKRSGSFSDSFRDRRALEPPVQKVLYKSTELFLAYPYAGSLVRGNLLPPGHAFVDVVAPSTPGDSDRAAPLFPLSANPPKGPSAMSGPGMKKLLGSVRRALSTRAGLSMVPSSSPTQGSFPQIPPLGVRGATLNRLPGTAVVPQARPRHTGIKTPPTRIDLLGAVIAEDFKKAVQEEAEAEAIADAERRDPGTAGSIIASEQHADVQSPMKAPDLTVEPPQPETRRDPVSEMTSGSKSIVIVDDTVTNQSAVMTGALPLNTSMDDDFAEAYMQPTGGPTPPSTPPEPQLGTPRRSSHLLGQHTRNRSLSLEDPSLLMRWSVSRASEQTPSSRPAGHPSMQPTGPPFKRSVSLRRYASYHSGFTRHKSERSFDATTFTGSEVPDRMSHVPSVPLPLRVLRRRPGGDLRAVTKVGDLNSPPLRRPMSTGSLTNYSESIRSSYLLGSGPDSSAFADVASRESDAPARPENTFSLGALAEAAPKPRVSLFSTHSSQPVMRPSFEKEAQMLAQIPDDMHDDGGVESALLKLEGRFDQRSSNSQHSGFNDRGDSFGAHPLDVSTLALDDDDEEEEEEEEEKRRHRHEHIIESSVAIVPAYRPSQASVPEELKPTVYQPKGLPSYPAALSPRSVESYSSIPLLERGLSDHGMKRRTRDWSERSILRGPSTERHYHNEHTPESSHVNSFDFIDDSDSLRRIPVGQTMPTHQSIDQSFLDSESDNRSDLSSELSLEVISRTDYTDHDAPPTGTCSTAPSGALQKDLVLPSHPLRHPPSPPITLTQALQLSPEAPNDPIIPRRVVKPPQNGLPPTPEFTPTSQGHEAEQDADRGATPTTDPLRSHRIPEPSRKTSVHLPFILAFDSQILAQQFTLIEKDALNEIDWKDLIEMRWKDASTESRSWVDFLRSAEPRGVEVVIARFNLVVKWAVSEIVLTDNLEERVRTIIKYIHIAAQCRKYRNFATMTQLTVALTSKDVSRLTQTWHRVPKDDSQTLKQLEALVTPTGNFHSLRAEMEGAGADQGCIPFVGIYTHDLLINCERPSQIASTPTTEPLVNFERRRTDATIVKNLLRLLEASQLYRFLPIEGVTERCLWMAALKDEEIARYGRAIQP
ncbi:hypothetical protein BJ875DRAFT_11777 [Amylocarpus encephaloides]|uniref:Guanine nucleotide exchange factor LTE1 n=1 Tax=Amylocarpus encephaloides TaxID=45428 RepID=A0A9P8C5Q5_9HELO|nr:hypothetical protein BJ875DRAFT_11777 [Amylocarpus encephaloides]